MAKDKEKSATTGKSKSKSRAQMSFPDDRFHYQDESFLWFNLHQSALWTFVSKSKRTYNLALVRSFYSNLRRDRDVIYSMVKNTPLELTLEHLGRIVGLPFQGSDISNYGREDWV
ncbi:unnamed protein product [Cuscuta campestris]|uniref:Uncharacterized protein n=1 Tax=Cuscuta campestris TaxID=132261 RepID=A0A484KXK6_9ASTE|nr:unnamed protein product [Cuscuta campestris]